METTGVKTFTTQNRAVAKNAAPKPIAQGEYTCAIRPEHIKIGQSDKRRDAVPYISYSIEVFNTALTEGGKNRLVFPMLLLGLNPGKDGVLNIDRANGLTALTKALGTELEGVEVVTREVTMEDGSTKVLEYLNPQQVVDQLLRNQVGVEFKAFIKVETSEYNGEKQEKNVISKFIPRES